MPDPTNAIPIPDPTAPPLMTAPTYEFGYTISAKGETQDRVLKVISETDRNLYIALAKDASWHEANDPNVKGVYRRSPSPTKYWVRLASQDQLTHA
jgi:protein-L-isoaspartate O-methyltransferase